MAPAPEAEKPPWTPRAIGVLGFVCGPMAAAIATFINLRRLGERRRASLTLFLTAVGSVAFGAVLYWLPRGAAELVGRFIGNLISPFLYPLLQKAAFEKWEAAHPGVAAANAWKAAGWGLLGLPAFFLLVVVGLFPMMMMERVEGIQVYQQAPASVVQGQDFVLRIEVENTQDRPQVLNEIDIGSALLEGVTIQSTVPGFKGKDINIGSGDTRYYLGQTIPPKGRVAVEFHALGKKAGSFASDYSVCIDSETNCVQFQLAITVQP